MDEMFQGTKNKIFSRIEEIEDLRDVISTLITKNDVLDNIKFFIIPWHKIHAADDLKNGFSEEPTMRRQVSYLSCCGLFLAYAGKYELIEAQDDFDDAEVARRIFVLSNMCAAIERQGCQEILVDNDLAIAKNILSKYQQ